MSSKLEVLKQRITELEAENTELRKEIPYLRNKLSVSDAEIAELKRRNAEVLRANGEYNEMRDAENAKLRAGIVELKSEIKLRRDIDEFKKESESKKNCKFQTRCIQIAKEILNEEPMIEYCPPFLPSFKNIEGASVS